MDRIYLEVDGDVIAHNDGWLFPNASDYEDAVNKFLPDDWKKWTIFRVYGEGEGRKMSLICGRVRA